MRRLGWVQIWLRQVAGSTDWRPALGGAAGVIPELWYALAVKRFAGWFLWPAVAWVYIGCAGLVAWRWVGLAAPGCLLILKVRG